MLNLINVTYPMRARHLQAAATAMGWRGRERRRRGGGGGGGVGDDGGDDERGPYGQVRRDGGHIDASARTWASSGTQLSPMVRFSGRRNWRGGFTPRGVTSS
jgi:hypothetical protein